ncbi:cysteine proteinase [Phlegmacium glaucopus]|nr:cysteine proteinase [Phlegmacium glaucopus]
MAPKRKRNASLPPRGLAPGELLKRNAINSTSPWGWVGTEVTDLADITLEHQMLACNLSQRNDAPYCCNKFAPTQDKANEDSPRKHHLPSVNGELDDDIIVISDDEQPSCSKKLCKANPNCLNYLGQEMWEDEDEAEQIFLKAAKLGENPSYESREPDLPVGLKNLGATCYANASLQVWYRDLAFRAGVYHCKPPEGISEDKYQESPIFQLQVTFAALQEGNKSVFNPTKLVESLQLRTSEQQDAQEFSKLFMSHLDAEFKKQSLTSVKSLITDQFQGSQVYGTICHACRSRSERVSDFLEVEIIFESSSKLEDRIAASLLPETLSGDNQYFCSQCKSLQDATRYTELRKLPPVLHFSLLRFIYDVSTMERKKSKHSIAFPTILDMGKFLGSKNDRERCPKDNDDNTYELRGILLHKGTSAYHGHYEAQVNDIEIGSWFQFNDEIVTQIKSLGDNVPKKLPKADEEPNPSQAKRNRINARKRQRIDDSDDDDVIESFRVKRKTTNGVSPKPPERGSMISSKDAYMLIYAKRVSSTHDIDVAKGPSNGIERFPQPPARALKVIHGLNASHDTLCEGFQARESEMKGRFGELRRKVVDIYHTWHATPCVDSIIVSQQALETWLSTHCIATALPASEMHQTTDDKTGSSHNSRSVDITISDILCEHNYLDPTKAQKMKRINLLACNQILEETNCLFNPTLGPSDICHECVSNLFKEKLYEIEHPRNAKRFDDISLVPEDELGYWISKRWCRDWRLLKPKMHVASENDPAPDSSEFYNHVHCEHGGLSLNTTLRRKISREAVTLLQELFPTWTPIPSDSETCAICDAEVHISKEDKREIRRRVEEEKARLRFLHETSLNSWTELSDPQPCAIIPSQFVKSWRRWLNNPCDSPRPDMFDNASFICEHELLAFDPNCPADLDSTIMIIELNDWHALESFYPGGHLIALTRRPRPQEIDRQYDHEISVCTDCRMKRKSEWDSTDIIIRFSGPKGASDSKTRPNKAITTYSRTNGARQSRRLRQIKEYGERRRINVGKSTTVKEMKIMVNEEFLIPTICQRLFYHGQELEDNSATVATLQLLANDVIDLREADEVIEIDSDSDSRPINKRRREEGQGFWGTLLGNTDSSWSSSPEQTPVPPLGSESEKPCLVCTFSNTFDAVACQICDTIFV